MRLQSSTSCQLSIHDMGLRSSTPFQWLHTYHQTMRLTLTISLGAKIIHPKHFTDKLTKHKAMIIHLAGCVSQSMGPKSSPPCIRWLIIQCHIICFWTETIQPYVSLSSLSNHKALVIHLAGCVSHSVILRSSTPCISRLVIYTTRPYSSTLCLWYRDHLFHLTND